MRDDSIDALLKRWGYWLWIGDDPGLFYERVNIIAKLRQQPRGVVDWSDAEAVNRAVVFLMESWPKVGVALKCWYEFRPEILGIKRKKERAEARRQIFCRRVGQDIPERTFGDYLRQGRSIVAAHLAGQEAA